MPQADVVVIGAGLSGLTCAAELAERGARVFLAAKGTAATHWSHGGTDIAAPEAAPTARDGVMLLAADRAHPYASLADEVEPALEAQRIRLGRAGLDLVGALDAPLVHVPTAIGSLRRAAILPGAQAAALEPWSGRGLLLVGIRHYRDAWPAYAARNLSLIDWPDGPGEIRAVEVDLPELDTLHNLNARSLALLFDDGRWRERALRELAKAVPPGAWRIGLPAVLGLGEHAAALREAEAALGHPVFEIPSLPPSIPGVRQFEALKRAFSTAGGRLQIGFDVSRVERDGRRITAVHTHAASRTLRIAADAFVLATGGIAGEGTWAHPDGRLEERVFGLPVAAPPREDWFSDDPLRPHPLAAAGIPVDAELRPIDADGAPVLDNVVVIGSALAGMHYLDQRCGDGVALASARRAASVLSRSKVPA